MTREEQYYIVAVERDGKRRTCTIRRREALLTVQDAVREGLVVSCRPMVDGDALILGVKVEAL